MAKKDEKDPSKDDEKKLAAAKAAAHRDEEDEHGEEEDEDDVDDDDDDEDESDEEEDEDDVDDDDDEDESDEEEDEDDVDDDHHTSLGVVAPAEAEPHGHDPNDPTWWLPHAVLAGLVLLGVLGFLGVFTNILGPQLQRFGLLNAVDAAAPSSSAALSAAPKLPAGTAPQPTPRPTPMPVRPTAQQPQAEQLGAKHLVVQYKGAAGSSQTRSKDEAKARAEEALKKLKGGAKWEDIVGKYSDEPKAAEPQGRPRQVQPELDGSRLHGRRAQAQSG